MYILILTEVYTDITFEGPSRIFFIWSLYFTSSTSNRLIFLSMDSARESTCACQSKRCRFKRLLCNILLIWHGLAMPGHLLTHCAQIWSPANLSFKFDSQRPTIGQTPHKPEEFKWQYYFIYLYKFTYVWAYWALVMMIVMFKSRR